MTGQQIITLIGREWWASRSYWGATTSEYADTLAIVNALTDAGLVVDDQIGPLSVEARIVKVLDKLHDHYEGQYTQEDVGEEIAIALGLVKQDEWSGEFQAVAA